MHQAFNHHCTLLVTPSGTRIPTSHPQQSQVSTHCKSNCSAIKRSNLHRNPVANSHWNQHVSVQEIQVYNIYCQLSTLHRSKRSAFITIKFSTNCESCSASQFLYRIVLLLVWSDRIGVVVVEQIELFCNWILIKNQRTKNLSWFQWSVNKLL